MNLEEISKKVMRLSKDTVAEVQKMNEVRQLNAKVNEEKKLLNRLYTELGQKLYDLYKDAEMPLEGFESDFRRIEERYSAMDLIQDQIRAVKGVVLCPCCNMEVAVTERYCSNCGNKMPEIVTIEENASDDGAVIIEAEATEVIDATDEIAAAGDLAEAEAHAAGVDAAEAAENAPEEAVAEDGDKLQEAAAEMEHTADEKSEG